MPLDPLEVPYMQRALGGGGAVTEREMRDLFQRYNPNMAAGMAQAGRSAPAMAATPQIGNLGIAPSVGAPQIHSQFGSQPSSGDAGQMAGQLAGAYANRGTPASYDSASGNWTPGSGGFPSGGGANGSSGFGQAAGTLGEMAMMAYGK